MQHITNSHGSSIYNLKKQTSTESVEKSSSNQIQRGDSVEATESSSVLAKKKLNAAILRSNLDVSLSAGNEPMSLLFKAAIEEINIALEEELGGNAIQKAYASGLDASPEATAKRIVSMSTAFFAQYRDQNPDMTDSEAANKFVNIIEGGVDTGFSEAREILDGLKVLEGDTADNIDETYKLITEGLKAFVDSFKEEEKIEESE
ncbi:MAG: DUF5610 domain-containing protein [Methylococcales bacterium]|nr:DUF5610 domain-containing protein [Methylococcales bacterium]